MTVPGHRIASPELPEAPRPFRFPVIATAVPVVVSVTIWLVTGSAFALIFAALGPASAIATYADARWGGRKAKRIAVARFLASAQETSSRIIEINDCERDNRREQSPTAGAIIGRPGSDPLRWAALPSAQIFVTLGEAATRGVIEFDAAVRPRELDPAVSKCLDDLEESASTLSSSPVVADARDGIGVCGARVLTDAYARAIAVQVAWALPPNSYWIATDHAGPYSELADALPHHRAIELANAGGTCEFGLRGDRRSVVLIAVAPTEADLPGGCRVVVHLSEGVATVTRHPDRAVRGKVAPHFISSHESVEWAVRASVEATREGLVDVDGALPHVVHLAPLLAQVATGAVDTLACIVGVGAGGPIALDLVRDGPHAVVGGTTGSGKSELLVAWVLSMAAAYSPARVTFLLVDFKGGTAFESLNGLAHTVGVVTDLDERGAGRALDSLRAELRYREAFLIAQGARAIEQTDSLPRLVILVDEFAAMISVNPELHALFGDLASRGRSLGVHLVLCTQRPSGVVRDGVLANVDLRISLRVNNRSDSIAVVGVESAAEISAENRGRAILQVSGGGVRNVQFAIASASDIAAIAARWSDAPAPRRPWCEPLPTLLTRTDLDSFAGDNGFGVTDLPAEQRRALAQWHPPTDGHVLILGCQASGKSNAVRALAHNSARVTHVPRDIEGAWDTVSQLCDDVDWMADSEPTVVAFDDLDSTITHFSPEHRAVFVERLCLLLRDGPARRLNFVLSAQRITPDLNSIASLVAMRLLLRHASRQDFVLAGGDGAGFAEGVLPGGGLWRGQPTQVVLADQGGNEPRHGALQHLDPSATRIIISSRVRELVGRLSADPTVRVISLEDTAGDIRELLTPPRGDHTAIVGDVEQWQGRWGAVNAARGLAEVVFDGCSVSDYRVLTRSRELPPPLRRSHSRTDALLVWRFNLDGSASRASLAVPPTS